MAKVILEKGKYYFGDPCYVIRNDTKEAQEYWERFCKHYFNEAKKTGFIDFEGLKGFVQTTAFGDGEYEATNLLTNDVKFIPVDAGMIGVLKIEKHDEKIHVPLKAIEYGVLGSFVDFEEEFVCQTKTYKYCKNFFIENWKIRTWIKKGFCPFFKKNTL